MSLVRYSLVACLIFVFHVSRQESVATKPPMVSKTLEEDDHQHSFGIASHRGTINGDDHRAGKENAGSSEKMDNTPPVNRSTRTMEDEQNTGRASLNFEDGGSYNGGYQAGQKQGLGVEKDNNGNTYQGYFKNDLKDGAGILKYEDGSESAGIWLKGRFVQGSTKTGSRQSRSFENDLGHGEADGREIHHTGEGARYVDVRKNGTNINDTKAI